MFTTIISLLAIAIVWNLIYRVIRGRTSFSRKVKTTIVVLLFSSLIIRFSHDIYASVSRLMFSFNKQGEVELVNSPLKIPPNQDATYCRQFTDQKGRVIEVVSSRDDGRYCGEFWHFKSDKSILIPYKTLNNNQTIYWASPSLKIIGPKFQ
ncbi:hypothetical protein [Legionella gresilensis]|uniref:hypothetical protein n=1 Tax=Legionella gresilensis TaxID=91823 RepID=UPI0010417617|nr:hypothetical protein [Legionella gresilensis]